MIVKLEIDDTLQEDEMVIRCKEADENIELLIKYANDISARSGLKFYKDNSEYYIAHDKIYFFETSGNMVIAHTADNFYQVKHKLYELEQILPFYFIRVSKSTILNVSEIHSIERNITSSSIVKFNGTHKQVYVSRNYYKALKLRIENCRNMLF